MLDNTDDTIVYMYVIHIHIWCMFTQNKFNISAIRVDGNAWMDLPIIDLYDFETCLFW